jgi:hypothetical protein
MNAYIRLTAALITSGVLVCSSLEAAAQGAPADQQGASAQYLNGGIGEDETANMHRVIDQYSLRLTFSERRGAFISDVSVAISGSKGKNVFQLDNAGPLLYVKLPPGKYKVRASYKGQTQAKDVSVPQQGGRYLSMQWSDPGTEVLSGSRAAHRGGRDPATQVPR